MDREMKLTEIFEARKNPELNLRLSAYEQLSDYKKDPHAYIHFSNQNKLGINPLLINPAAFCPLIESLKALLKPP